MTVMEGIVMNSRHGELKVWAAAVGTALVTLVSTSTAAPDDLHSLQAAVTSAVGPMYYDTQSEILALPPEQRDALIAELQGSSRPLEERVVGLFLFTRAQYPALAAEFDTNLIETLANPRSTRGGRSVYDFKVRLDLFHADPLIFETLIKGEMPIAAKVQLISPLGNTGRINPLNIEPLLSIIHDDAALRSRAVRIIGKIAAEHPDERIAPALKEAFIDERPISSTQMANSATAIVDALRQDASTGALAAIEEIIVFEQELMSTEGMSPWIDVNAVENAMNAAKAAGRAMGRAMREGRSVTAAEQAVIDEKEVAAHRMQARLLWQRLIEARDVLRALHPPPPTSQPE